MVVRGLRVAVSGPSQAKGRGAGLKHRIKHRTATIVSVAGYREIRFFFAEVSTKSIISQHTKTLLSQPISTPLLPSSFSSLQTEPLMFTPQPSSVTCKAAYTSPPV